MTSTPVRRRPAPGPAVVSAAGPRRAARGRADRSARRRRGLRHAGRALLLSLPLLAAAWVLLGSSWLMVDRVVVTGLSRLTEAEVRAVVGVEEGTPLARVDTGDVARSIRRLPAVAGVAVERSWPATLRVEVRERTVAAGVAENGAVTLVDAQGVRFATEPRLPSGVARLETDDPGPGDPATRAALTVLESLPAELRRRVVAVTAEDASHVTLRLGDDQRVLWGRPGGTQAKAAAALALLREPGDVLDVSDPTLVVRS